MPNFIPIRFEMAEPFEHLKRWPNKNKKNKMS